MGVCYYLLICIPNNTIPILINGICYLFCMKHVSSAVKVWLSMPIDQLVSFVSIKNDCCTYLGDLLCFYKPIKKGDNSNLAHNKLVNVHLDKDNLLVDMHHHHLHCGKWSWFIVPCSFFPFLSFHFVSYKHHETYQYKVNVRLYRFYKMDSSFFFLLLFD